MGKYIIKGGNSLDGKVKIESAKNAVLPMLAGAILTNDDVVIKNCPKIRDVLSMINILNSLGVETTFIDNNLVVNASGLDSYTIPDGLAKELRSSVFMLGALISRVRKARIACPGGCDIGLRPIDIHIQGLRELGVSITELPNEIICTAQKIVGKKIVLDFPSVGATENLILASVFVSGTTVIKNCAKEPEIEDLVNFLNSMGANICGGGTSEITICGVKRLYGTEYTPIPDRIEAGTFLIASAITGGEIEISNVKAENISILINKLLNNTCKIRVNNDIIHIQGGMARKCFSVSTMPYPGFPTDLQAQIMALASVSLGTSVIQENIFEMRFKHIEQFLKMGANIKVQNKCAIVSGVKQLHGANVFAQDLRGGASLVLAGLVAEGKTIVNDIKHIERGYYLFDEKLRMLGVDIKKNK